ncbi:MAG TPA: zinc ABC transporter substrate-binding protein, partial [Rubricoccaceae bacterium]
SPPEFAGHHDPHVWMDVSRWMKAVEAVAEALAGYDAANASLYRENAKGYLAELARLHEYAVTSIGSIPEKQRVLVTAHDAFNYFGRAYGVDVRGLQGISTATEAGTADVRELAAFVAERRLPALFVESSVSPRAIEAVRAAVRSRGFEVRIGGSLYSDALGGPGSGADTYEGMIRANVDTVVDGLNGTADTAARRVNPNR